jgi:MFS family permease
MRCLRHAVARLRERPALWSFAGVFTSAFLGFLAIGAVLPILPRYVRGPLDAGDVAVGVVTGAFAVSAVVFRPIGGSLADAHGRRPIVAIGLTLVAIAGLLYLLPAGVAGLVAARLVLGIGDGWMFTAGAAWIVDLAPVARRGQIIGLFGLAVWGGLSLGPLIGEATYALGSYDAVFVLAAALPALGALLALRLPERRQSRRWSGGGLRFPLPRAVVAPGAALALANVGYGAVSGFLVLHLGRQGIGHGTAAFTAFAASVVAARLVGSRLPDLVGGRRSAMGAATAEAGGLVLLATATSTAAAFAGAILMGIGFSLLFPSLALLAVQRVGEERRGTALGAFTAFFDVGVGVGAPLMGTIASAAGYPAAFWTAAGFAVGGAAVAALIPERGRQAAAPEDPA